MSVTVGRWAGRPLRLSGVSPRLVEVVSDWRYPSGVQRDQYYMVAVLLGRQAVGLRGPEVAEVMSALSQKLGSGVVSMFPPHKGLFVRRDEVDVGRVVKNVVDCLCTVPGRFVYMDEVSGRCEVVTDGCDQNGIPKMVVVS